MIRAAFFRQNGALTGFEISGHAGYAEKGYDIVCAAVSAASTMIANGLQEILKLVIDVEMNEETGYLQCMLPDDAGEGAQILLKTLRLGLKSIEENYPGTLRVTYTNRRK